jgi:FixJ family two-component response regulator
MKPQPVVHVIDDDTAMLRVLATLIEMAGFKTKAYTSAREFLNANCRAAPECLVLDIRLPGMNGFELQKELARRGRLLPIVFITGHADVEVTDEAKSLGAVAFLEKPFRAQELVQSVEQAFALDTASRQVAM